MKKKTDLKMDVRDMKVFEDASFDAVIDKGIHCFFFIIPSALCVSCNNIVWMFCLCVMFFQEP